MGLPVSGLALLSEGSRWTGSGHIVETLHLSRALANVPWRAYLSRQTPPALLKRFGSRAQTVDGFSPVKLARLGPSLLERGLSTAVLNFLKIEPTQVNALKRCGLKVVCITAKGGRPAHCDLWIDLGIGARSSTNSRGGPKFMVLSPAFRRWARRARVHRGRITRLLILMGGTDFSGASAALVGAMAGRLASVEKHVVAGPNFAHLARLRQALASVDDGSFRLHRSPADLPALMARSDAAFTFGSDTSLELACVGTPTILLHEAPHERRQALFLARKGCGLFFGPPSSVTARRALSFVRRLDDPAVRNRCARAGRRLVDGRGGERVARILRRGLVS